MVDKYRGDVPTQYEAKLMRELVKKRIVAQDFQRQHDAGEAFNTNLDPTEEGDD